MAITVHTGASDIARVTVTNASSNTTIAINKPANVVDGDLMLLKVSSNNTLNPSSIALSDPTYWGTAINENFGVNGATACHTAYYAKEWSTGDATSWTATIGASTLDDESCVVRVSGHDPVTPIDVAAASQSSTQSTGPVSPSVITLTDNAVVIYGVSAKNGSVLTAEDIGNPVGTTLIQNKRSRSASGGVNSGLAYELRATAGATGTRTWLAYTTTSQYHSAYSFAIRPYIAPAYQIDDINTDEEIDAGSTGNTLTVSGFSNAITALTIGGKAATSIAGSDPSYTFTMPGFVHEASYPEPDATHDAIATDSAANDSGALPVLLNSPAGMTSVVIASAVTDDDTFMGYWMDLNGHTPVNGDRMAYITADCTGGANTSVTTDAAKTTTIWHWVLATGIIYEYTVSINEAGVASMGLTSRELTARSLTASTLTARSL